MLPRFKRLSEYQPVVYRVAILR